MAGSIPESGAVEPTAGSDVESTMRTMDERLSDLQRQVDITRGRVEDYTRENPLMALGIAFIAGYIIGKLMS